MERTRKIEPEIVLGLKDVIDITDEATRIMPSSLALSKLTPHQLIAAKVLTAVERYASMFGVDINVVLRLEE